MASTRNGAGINGDAAPEVPPKGAIKRKKKKLEDDPAAGLVKCPVCRKPYNQPKLLPCLHSFCDACLQTSLQGSDLGPGDQFLCPLCHTECVIPKRGTSALQDNFLLTTLGQFQRRKSVPKRPRCQGCDPGHDAAPPAVAKCIECDDWLCGMCVDMHKMVKVTRSHHVMTPDDLDGGQADSLIKASAQPLNCRKHQEPLKLFCNDPTCQIPICAVCRNTLGHDGHQAIELEQKALRDTSALQNLLPNVNRGTEAIKKRMENIQTEDKMTSAFKKQMHRDINARMDEVVQRVVKGVGDYGEFLHGEVDRLAKEHKDDLKVDLEESKRTMSGFSSASTLAQGLLEEGRQEELVRMFPMVSRRLQTLQQPPDTNPPGWRKPRMHPAHEPSQSDVASLFGELTFEGHIVRSQEVLSFSAKTESDPRKCSISDVCISEDNDIVIVDKDNKKVKIFSATGQFLFSTDENKFKNPVRATIMKNSGNVIIKDDKLLRMMQPDGSISGSFASKVRHPIATSQNKHGEILVSDWNSGNVHCFTPDDKEVFTFSTNLEAPAYLGSTPRDHVLVSDWKQNLVRVYERGGRFLWQYGRDEAHNLNHPYGVCSDRYGHVLIADSWNHRVVMLSEEGRFMRFLLDKDAGLNYPQALAVTKDGLLVVAELNGTVRVCQYLA